MNTDVFVNVSETVTGNLSAHWAELEQRVIAQNSDIEVLGQMIRNLSLKQG